MTINLTNMLTSGTYLNSNIRIEKLSTMGMESTDGIKITLSSDMSNPNDNPASLNSSESYVFKGTAAEIKTQIEAETAVAALAGFFTV